MGKILVVDDNESILHLIRDFFTDLKGHQVFIASNAKEAMEIVTTEHPEVALLDIMMPEVHGIELLSMIKRAAPDVKVIMITAVDDESIAKEAMDKGAVDYVTKPLELNYLDALVTFQMLE
jgi:DNA-binding response OmpR family regulator